MGSMGGHSPRPIDADPVLLCFKLPERVDGFENPCHGPQFSRNGVEHGLCCDRHWFCLPCLEHPGGKSEPERGSHFWESPLCPTHYFCARMVGDSPFRFAEKGTVSGSCR